MNLLTQPKKPSFSITAKDVRWIERTLEGKIKKVHLDNPQIGYILFLNPYQPENTYFTSEIIKIVESTDTSVEFKTEDGEYKLFLDSHFTKLLEL